MSKQRIPIGSRVCVTQAESRIELRGREGVLVKDDGTGCLYKVQLDGSPDTDWFVEDSLERADTTGQRQPKAGDRVRILIKMSRGGLTDTEGTLGTLEFETDHMGNRAWVIAVDNPKGPTISRSGTFYREDFELLDKEAPKPAPPKFKAGDRVRVLRKWDGNRHIFWNERMDATIGREGTVVSGSTNKDSSAFVQFDNGTRWHYYTEVLELVQSHNAKTFLQEETPPTSTPEEPTLMNGNIDPVKLENTTFITIPGDVKRDVKSLDLPTLVRGITLVENEIKAIDALEHKPQRLIAYRDELNNSLATMVELLDKLDADDAKAAKKK